MRDYLQKTVKEDYLSEKMSLFKLSKVNAECKPCVSVTVKFL